MSDLAVKRIQKELDDVINSNKGLTSPNSIKMKSDNLFELVATITGPSGTPYEGGTFELEIKMPENYPFSPPNVSFKTPIWHPNISSASGTICNDFLNDQWNGSMSLRTLLLSIQVLLDAAEADAAGSETFVAANQYKNNKEIFVKTAEFWTALYAGGSKKDSDCLAKLESLQEFGLNRRLLLKALSFCNWDKDAVIYQLLYGQ